MAHLVANRQGEVLGPHAILKEDHFPGDPATSPVPGLAAAIDSAIDVNKENRNEQCVYLWLGT